MSERETETVTSSTPAPMRRTTFDDDDLESSTSTSASLSLLSLFASNPGCSDSVISSSAGGSTRGSAPHTPPSASSSPSTDLPGRYTITTANHPYNYPVHSNDATSKTPLRREDDEDDDEIVLGYTPNYPVTVTTSTLGAPQPNPSKFSVQRSAILKINALTGTANNAAPRTLLTALLHPAHHPRSLWTLASLTEEEEPFVWAIFDSHEHALSALSSLSTTNPHPPIAQPALESDLYPFSKLQKVDMKSWAARHAPESPGGLYSSAVAEHERSFQGSPGAYSASPGASSPMQRYSSTDAYSYSYSPTMYYSPTQGQGQGYSPTNTKAYSPQNAYSLQNAYPPALYHHTTYHNHTHQSTHTSPQEITTPIPLSMHPHPHPQPHPQFDPTGSTVFEDHSTPIPPSHAPYTPIPIPPSPSHTAHSRSSEVTRSPYPSTSEMKPHTRESPIGDLDLDETGASGDEFRASGLDGFDGFRPGDETSAEPHRTKTPHSPHSVAASRSPITGVAGSRSSITAAPSLLPGNAFLPPGNGSRDASAEFPETEAGRDGDGETQGALKRQFGTRHQDHSRAGRAGRASESETSPVNVREGEPETRILHGALENNTHVRLLWGGVKGKEQSILDRDLDGPREEGESNFNPGSPGSAPGLGLAPSSSSFSFGASFIREHLPSSHSSNFTSHVARPDRPDPDTIGEFRGLDVHLVRAKEKKMEMLLQLGTASEFECIEKSEWTATVGVYPKEQPKPTPAETSFPPLPSNHECDRDRLECRRLPPPDQSSYLPLADARPPPDADRVKTNFCPASTSASQTSALANANTDATANGSGNGVSNASGGASVGGYGSLGRFSPMLDRPIRSRGVSEDEGYDDGGRGRDEMQRGRARAGLNYHVEDAACSLRSSDLPPNYQTLQQFRQKDLQKQPFLHEQPPHSLSFFHQNQTQHHHQQAQQQQQSQNVYHTNLGIAPPTAFRHGDWLCNMPGCGAHNFGRNVSCIMCGAERAASAAVGAGLGFGYAAAVGTGRMQPSGGMSMGMGVTMDGENELNTDYAYALVRGGANTGMGTGANAVGLNYGRLPISNTFSSQSYSLGHPSTHIPVIPRFGGQHYNVGAPQTANGDIAMNSTLVQALGGIGQVAAIQEAIKAHQSQMQPQDGRGRLGGANNAGFAGQRHGGRDSTFSMPAQGGQLLIPTTLGNSPPTSLPQGPVVVQQGRGSRFGEARDGQGRNPNLMVPGMQHHGLPSTPSPYSPQGHSMQQNNHVQHPLPLHPGIFSPASAALAAAAIPASKMPALLTPSGRKFAAGGRVQNISRDELNPLLMFWPDNEPLPLTSQIRPPAAVLMALGGVQGPPPPILNTGNKGPIDAQPGDWTCGKCDYLNWRRRRVCANCFPHAEGNTEGTKHSTNDVQERVALLASVIFQQQQQVQAQQRQIQSQQATAAAFASPPNESISQSGNPFAAASFVPSNVGSGTPSQQQSYVEAPRRNDAMPLSKMDSMSMQLLAQKYGYAVPPPSGLRSTSSTNSFEQPLPLNLPPRMTHHSAPEGIMSRGFMDLNRNAPSFQPIRTDGVSQFDGLPQRLRSSPPSSRSSFSIGSNSSFYKSANEPTPSPLPLLPAFLQEVVGETSESSSSSVHESPSPPSPSSTSSAFLNTYSGDPRLSELVGAGLRRRERSSPASGTPQISNNNIHRTASQSSIWSFGYPGDRKEGIRPV